MITAFPATVAENASLVKPVSQIDHIAYVSRFENQRSFITRWKLLGFHERVRLYTSCFPATHIALVNNKSIDFSGAMMTELSVSRDPRSPINEFVRRYGEGVQHTAYRIVPEVCMEELQLQMKDLGWNFMTPVLTYKNASGTLLKQMFTVPINPYGPFIEFIQRPANSDGSASDSIDTSDIEELYQHYIEYSRSIDK